MLWIICIDPIIHSVHTLAHAISERRSFPIVFRVVAGWPSRSLQPPCCASQKGPALSVVNCTGPESFKMTDLNTTDFRNLKEAIDASKFASLSRQRYVRQGALMHFCLICETNHVPPEIASDIAMKAGCQLADLQQVNKMLIAKNAAAAQRAETAVN